MKQVYLQSLHRDCARAALPSNQFWRRAKMNIRNIPGFTAEDSLYLSRTKYSVTAAHHYGEHNRRSSRLLHGTVLPQLPVRLGRVCSPCTVQIGGFGLGIRRCTDYACDLETLGARGRGINRRDQGSRDRTRNGHDAMAQLEYEFGNRLASPLAEDPRRHLQFSPFSRGQR